LGVEVYERERSRASVRLLDVWGCPCPQTCAAESGSAGCWGLITTEGGDDAAERVRKDP
jgi:hypothetical protein